MGVKERERLFFLFPSPDVGSTKYVELVPDVEEASCSKNMTPGGNSSVQSSKAGLVSM